MRAGHDDYCKGPREALIAGVRVCGAVLFFLDFDECEVLLVVSARIDEV
jgi:hypothetical protein